MTRALVVGAGISGLATSIALRQRGIEVELVERGHGLQVLGSGITLVSAAIRALEKLDVLTECLANGFGVRQFTECNVNGDEIRTVDLPSAVGEGGPGILGMMRPTLHHILYDKAMSLGVEYFAGVRPKSLTNKSEHVQTTLSDGRVTEHDLVIGCDGIHSSVREMVFGDYPLEFRNQGCFRAVVRRPDVVDKEMDFAGHPGVHPGFTPISNSQMYIYCNAASENTSLLPQDEIPTIMREILAPFGGLMAEAREEIRDPRLVNYRPYETLLVPQPWNRGRILLLGDSAHSTTPHLAAGAAMCLEDAVVLGEELSRASIPEALETFSARRFDRVRFVVETSVRLSKWQLNPHEPGFNPGSVKDEARRVLAGAY